FRRASCPVQKVEADAAAKTYASSKCPGTGSSAGLYGQRDLAGTRSREYSTASKAVASDYGSKPDWSACCGRPHVTLKSSSGSGGLWFLMYSAHTSSVTLPLLATQ